MQVCGKDLGSHYCGRLDLSKKGGNMNFGGYRPSRRGFHSRYMYLPTSIEGRHKFWTTLRVGTTML
jgi:hypothetical protein